MAVVKMLTADEKRYLSGHSDLTEDHDFQNDANFQRWIRDLTNGILDGVFPRKQGEVGKENLEALTYLYKHPTKKLTCDPSNCLKLFEPLNLDKFNVCRRHISGNPNREVDDLKMNTNRPLLAPYQNGAKNGLFK